MTEGAGSRVSDTKKNAARRGSGPVSEVLPTDPGS